MNLSLININSASHSIAILFCKGLKQVRSVALFGSLVQLGAALFLLYAYWHERAAGNTAQMLFEDGYVWFAPLISIIMLA